VAQQPPRLPDVGAPWAEALADRPVGNDDLGAREDGPGLGRRARAGGEGLGRHFSALAAVQESHRSLFASVDCGREHHLPCHSDQIV